MNILLDNLPETVNIHGSEYFIDTDFRTFIIYEKIILDDGLFKRDKVYKIMELFYTDKVPSDVAEACNAILDIYRCGEPPKESRQVKNGDVMLGEKLIFDYEYDAPYIYGAFLTQYGIDLNDIEYLHWWKFQAMFRSLNSSNKIVEMMAYRSMDLSDIKNDDERKRIARLQTIYALPQSMSKEEKVAQAGAVFGGIM